jgi:exopolysaccharide biosynthesis polyprenyl glycosylphosphotransferase
VTIDRGGVRDLSAVIDDLLVPAQRYPLVGPPLPAERSAVSRWERRYLGALAALDAVLILVAVLVSSQLRFSGAPLQGVNLAAALAIPLLWLGALAVQGVYEPRRLGATHEFRQVFDACLRVGAATATVAFLVHAPVSRSFLLGVLVIATLLLLAGRAGARAALHRMRRNGRCLHHVVAVGRPEDIHHLAEQARRAGNAGFAITAACTDGAPRGTVLVGDDADIPVQGTVADAVAVAVATKADTIAVVSTGGGCDRETLRQIAWEIEGTELRLLIAPAFTDVAGPRITVKPLAGLPLLHLEQPSLRGIRAFGKSVFERGVAAVALLLLSPLFLVVALAVRIDSRGPALYGQTRIGKGGAPFTCWKFRSMRAGADAELAALLAFSQGNGLLFKMREDPRVTRVGRLLRRFSIDELPQLFNVLLGSMSLVGPRPPLPTEVDRYETDVRRRLLVKPGMTGLWQVSGRSDLSWEESVRLDLYYVENWSPQLDMAIIARTIGAVVRSCGAY